MIAAAIAFGAAAALGVLARWAGPRLGALDHPAEELKTHARPVPYLGGVVVAGGLVAGLAVEGSWPRAAALGVMGVALLLGLVDDVRRLPPLYRLSLQLALGVWLAAGGLSATALPGRALAWAGAIVLLAAAVNAVNMVDGMDGLAGGTAAISALGIALVAGGQGHPDTLAFALVGATLGFLVHNRPPAGLFLGDNGAYLVGAALGVLVLMAGRSVPGLVGAGTCLGLFLLDLLLALVRRLAGGMRLTEGDRSHLYDQLARRGSGTWRTLVSSWGIHAVLVAAGVGLSHLATAWALAGAVCLWVAALAVLAAAGFVAERR